MSFLDACALHYFGKLLSFLHYLIFFDQVSTNFRRNFVHSLSCLSTKIRRMVTFDVMSDWTESCIGRRGFRQKVMDAVQSMWFKDYIFAKKYFYQVSNFPILLLLFLRTLVLCHISLVECFLFFNIISVSNSLDLDQA